MSRSNRTRICCTCSGRSKCSSSVHHRLRIIIFLEVSEFCHHLNKELEAHGSVAHPLTPVDLMCYSYINLLPTSYTSFLYSYILGYKTPIQCYHSRFNPTANIFNLLRTGIVYMLEFQNRILYHELSFVTLTYGIFSYCKLMF